MASKAQPLRFPGRFRARAASWWESLAAFLKDETNRKLFVIVLIFFISHTWTLAVFHEVKDPAEAGRWVRNQLTFSLIHWTAFAWAIATLSCCFKPRMIRDFLEKSMLKGSVRAIDFCYGSLVFLVVMLTALVIADSSSGTPDPYMLKQSDGALKAERTLRSERERLERVQDELKNMAAFGGVIPDDVKKARFNAYEQDLKTLNKQVKAYEDQFLAGTDTLRGKLATCNWVPAFSGFLTWFFGLFIVLTFWIIYVVLPMLSGELDRQRVQLNGDNTLDPAEQEAEVSRFERRSKKFDALVNEMLKVFILVSLWIPFRFYASWYCNFFLGRSIVPNYPAYMLVLFIACGALAILWSLKRGTDLLALLAAIGAAFSVVLGIAMKVADIKLSSIFSVMEAFLTSNPVFFLSLCVAVFFLTFAVTMIRPGQQIRRESPAVPARV